MFRAAKDFEKMAKSTAKHLRVKKRFYFFLQALLEKTHGLWKKGKEELGRACSHATFRAKHLACCSDLAPSETGGAPWLLSRFAPCPPFCVEEVTNEPRNKQRTELEKENAGGLIQPRSHKEAAGKV